MIEPCKASLHDPALVNHICSVDFSVNHLEFDPPFGAEFFEEGISIALIGDDLRELLFEKPEHSIQQEFKARPVLIVGFMHVTGDQEPEGVDKDRAFATDDFFEVIGGSLLSARRTNGLCVHDRKTGKGLTSLLSSDPEIHGKIDLKPKTA